MNLQTTLLSHQERAVEKLMRSRVGALFMEMGTGKTRVAIEFAAVRQERISNVVWFCPVTLKDTIEHEIRKHTDAEDGDIYVFDDKTRVKNLPAAFWYIIGIESMSSSNRVVLAANKLINSRSFVIVDESSYIKNSRARRSERITLLGKRARYRMILTGTPISQGVVDLYSQMYFLSPKILGYNSFYSFAANHLEYSEKYRGLIVRSHNTAWIAAKINPYVYQVTKDECLDLPDKLFDQRYFALTREQADLYYRAKVEILLECTDDELTSYTIFRLFTALQQIASGFWNRREEGADTAVLLEVPHERLNMLLDIIERIPADEKIIIWSKYRYSIQRITEALQQAYSVDQVALYYGDISEHGRVEQLDLFRAGARFLVASQATGGHGLTLNEARYVIFYENDFSYAHLLQAEDRCHRIGQTRPVTYIDIAARCGIDERILEALNNKGNAVKAFKQQVDKYKDLSRAEVRKRLVDEL